MRFRTTQYNSAVGANMVADVELQPTPGQIGVITDFPGAITDESSDYSYQPETAGIPAEFIGTGNYSTRRMGRLGRTPYAYAMPSPFAAVKGASASGTAEYAGAGRSTGSPGSDILESDAHGPFSPKQADGKIPTGGKAPVNRGAFLRKLFGVKDQTGERDEKVIPQAGDKDWNEETETPAALGQNTFIVPDIRATFDTQNVQGVGLGPDGKPYVAKAGRPTEDPQFDPMKVTITNRRQVRIAGSPPFLPDRTMAGAADPNQSRPAEIPQWFTERPFDKQMAEHMSGVKGVVRPNTAGRPIATANEEYSIAAGHAGQAGYHVVSPAPGMSPAGPMPNTVRQVPTAWDADLNVIEAGPSASRSRSFRRHG